MLKNDTCFDKDRSKDNGRCIKYYKYQNHDSSEGKIIILSGMGTNCIIPQEGSTTEGIVMLLQILIIQEAIREEIQEVPVVMRSEGAIRIMPTFFATRYMEEFLASKVVPNWLPIEGKINPTNTLAPVGSHRDKGPR
uniref:Uncharacterized protein n=1 Tax=Glossina palpalis gambiensis TaxID=67801 RepID=A0A1B0C5K7_9MUSC